MPIGKVPTEELFMEGTHSGGSYGEVSSPRNKTTAANITASAANIIIPATHIIVPAANIIIPTTHVIALAANIIARDTPYLKK